MHFYFKTVMIQHLGYNIVPGLYYLVLGKSTMRKKRVFVELRMNLFSTEKIKIHTMFTNEFNFSPWCSFFLAKVFDRGFWGDFGDH